MHSKKIESTELHEKMHNFDVLVYSTILEGKKIRIHYINKVHMHINYIVHAPFTCYKGILKKLKVHCMNKCMTLTFLYVAPFSYRKKIRDTLQKQSAYKFICSKPFYLLLMVSKKKLKVLYGMNKCITLTFLYIAPCSQGEISGILITEIKHI